MRAVETVSVSEQCDHASPRRAHITHDAYVQRKPVGHYTPALFTATAIAKRGELAELLE